MYFVEESLNMIEDQNSKIFELIFISCLEVNWSSSQKKCFNESHKLFKSDQSLDFYILHQKCRILWSECILFLSRI